jgi:hypothetical protein
MCRRWHRLRHNGHEIEIRLEGRREVGAAVDVRMKASVFFVNFLQCFVSITEAGKACEGGILN